MRKLIIRCECGQQLQVPYSALGKVGLCPNCGNRIIISSENARWDRPEEPKEFKMPSSGQQLPLAQEMKKMFGKAVDLFSTGHYAEALAIFDSFAQNYPDNPDIQEARNQCVSAIRRARTARLAQLPHLSAGNALDAETVKRVVLEKLLYGPTAAVQLEAADIACHILGLYNNNPKEMPAGKTEGGEEQDDGALQ